MIKERTYLQSHYKTLIDQGIDPVLARILASRGISSARAHEMTLANLLPIDNLMHCGLAAKVILDAITSKSKICIVADYDADGATACALGISVLRKLGADVSYFVPDRQKHGYGLTPEISHLVSQMDTKLLITVDNGIASVSGVDTAKELGMTVLITDHHLPAEKLPKADCIVNPNQPNDAFQSKNLAGVGVMFYVLIALRQLMITRNLISKASALNLADYLDLVALGTIADVVPLDQNNRILVSNGLRRLRLGKTRPGIRALFSVANRKLENARTGDLGFSIGPRLNAAGRLDDMRVGIECLLAENELQAQQLATQLDNLNIERREIEKDMTEQALNSVRLEKLNEVNGVVIYDERWHPGVVGILASRIKDKIKKPTIAFANSDQETIKGSGRSTKGIHLRDTLDEITKKDPDLIIKFGGHAAAAGLEIEKSKLDYFSRQFDDVVSNALQNTDMDSDDFTDGELSVDKLTTEFAQSLSHIPWGQSFPEPTFQNEFEVVSQKLLKDAHLKLILRFPNTETEFDAIYFNQREFARDRIKCIYRVDTNDFYKHRPLQLIVNQWF